LELDLFIARWGYLGIFLALFATGIGLPPLPEELAIIAAGGLAAGHPEVKWYLAWPACIVGVVLADLVLYWAGRWWGNSLFRYRWVARFLPPERRQKIEDGFHQHGVKILLSARLLPGLRTGVFMTAGAMRYPFVRFLVADGIYAIPGTAVVFFGSFFLTETFKLALEEVHKIQYWLLALLVLGAVGFGLYRYFRVAREHAAHEDFNLPTLPELMHSKHTHSHEALDGQAPSPHEVNSATPTANPSPASSGTHPAAGPK
jgi:membrane protein DedA with SNARE-associated domain